MDDLVVQRLVALNRAFYDDFAGSFAESRSSPPPGFARLLPYIPEPVGSVLDVGCGNGRFAAFLRQNGRQFNYVGVDFSPDLTRLSKTNEGDTYFIRNLVEPGCLDGTAQFACIACLSTLQHIPGERNRARLLAEMTAHLVPGGSLLLGNWQFMDSVRQRRKIVDWSQVGLSQRDVEPGDHLISWDRGGQGVRYANHVDVEATSRLAIEANLKPVASFRSDGREGDLNLYTILAG